MRHGVRSERLAVWFVASSKFLRRKDAARIRASRTSDGERHAH